MEPRKAAFERVLPNPKAKLLDQVREVCRLKHYSLRTEQSYVAWALRFLVFVRGPGGQWRHPRELGGKEVTEFLTHLAVDKELGASSQNQGMNALVFLYQEVLGQSFELGGESYGHWVEAPVACSLPQRGSGIQPRVARSATLGHMPPHGLRPEGAGESRGRTPVPLQGTTVTGWGNPG